MNNWFHPQFPLPQGNYVARMPTGHDFCFKYFGGGNPIWSSGCFPLPPLLHWAADELMLSAPLPFQPAVANS